MIQETQTVDTYETPVSIESGDALAAYRGLQEETRPKMSDTAKAKLRSINEHDRANAEADARLVKEFNSRPWTLTELVNLFAKSFGHVMNPRRAVKAMSQLAQGMRVYHIHDLTLFGELLQGESEMSMYKFLQKYPLPEDETVTPKGEPAAIKKVYWNEARCRKNGLCKAGSLCLKATNKGKPASAAEGKQYCGTACQGTYPIRLSKQQVGALAA